MKNVYLFFFICFLFLFGCSNGSGSAGGSDLFTSASEPFIPVPSTPNPLPPPDPTNPSSDPNPSTPVPDPTPLPEEPTSPPEEIDPCFLSSSSAIEAFENCGWAILYSPPYPHNPAVLTLEDHTAFLQQLYLEGWRILIMYSLDYSYEFVPQIAKNLGFRYVFAGIFAYDSAQFEREKAAALRQKDFIDVLIIGNEGIWDGRYTWDWLVATVDFFELEGFIVATSEGYDSYVENSSLLLLGSLAMPNLHSWWAGFREPSLAVDWTVTKYQELQALAPGTTIFLKEAWWPTSSSNSDDIAANEENQLEFYTLLAQTPVKFACGEASDQSWKIENGILYGWGIHTFTGQPKLIIQYLNDIWSSYRAQ